ncbi:asparagine synthase (glutamine-hydrolyzing) [Spirulina subsalsa]|uniref:asparagine synthase (glutamine-hydrolyzing) n=1 Tax=Spirulina subsalsa TaxID=54311 RepID=UPI0002EF34FA|nr:asparagine synthase (glutamine-hydrolyzing) [Spirulina subsalsa]
MCGLIGIASSSRQPKHTWLTIARDALTHRGPDDAGEWWSNDERVGLAHRRLSILDLSPLGHQPMHLAQQGLSIVFNGEIYNFTELRQYLEQRRHRFCSQSDTEVLLAAYAEWDTDCLTRLNGMFAFALYDARKERIFLARDRAGEKPLFYRLEGDTLYFASELKALLAHPSLPRRIDPEALDCYLAMGFVPGDRCILQGYRKLPPAHAMTFDLHQGNINIWCYWQLPELDPDASTIDPVRLVDELETLLEDAVGRQLMADVPVGILLSGGVDSSLITAMAVRQSSQVRTFSISFPGHGKLDESSHARLIAQYFNTEHTELVAEPTTADLLPVLAHQFDEPMVDSSMFPTWLVSHLVRQHCTVALGGDGGDELFGGYEHYSRLLWMQDKLAHLPYFVRRNTAHMAEKLLPVGVKGRNYLQGLDVDINSSLPLIASYFDRTTRRNLLRSYGEATFVAESIREARIPGETDLLQRATRMDFHNYLAEDILVKVDRASMLNSLEVRAPFLDYRLIEFAFGKVPSHLKATISDKKILLKHLTNRVLPPEFDKQRKQGFSIPMAEWLKSGLFRELFWDTLSSPDCLFDKKTVQNLLKGQDQGRSNGERLFALVQFELWRKTYNTSL